MFQTDFNIVSRIRGWGSKTQKPMLMGPHIEALGQNSVCVCPGKKGMFFIFHHIC